MLSLNPIFAEGRETRPNSRPVATAKPRTPTNASSEATALAAVPFGEILPYPTVLSVWELKKKSLRKRRHRGGCIGALELARTQRVIGGGEQRIGHQVAHEQRRQETGPTHVDQVQVGVKVAPRGAAAVHVEAAILIDDPPQGGRELLGQAGIEGGFPHIDEIAENGREIRSFAASVPGVAAGCPQVQRVTRQRDYRRHDYGGITRRK